MASGVLAYCQCTCLGHEPVKRTLQKHRRIFATGILLAFVLAWVLPVQACLVSAAANSVATPPSCLDCASPHACDMGHCGSSVSASCDAAMVPAVAASPQSLHQTVAPPALLDSVIDQPVWVTLESSILPDPPDARSAPSVNIRFCTFLE